MKNFLIVGAILVSTSAVAGNSPRYIDYIAKKDTDNTGWQWDKMQKLPIKQWQSKTPSKTVIDNYSIFGNFTKNKTIVAYGTQVTPQVVSFDSSVSADGNKKALWNLSDLVNKADIKPIQTDCTEALKPWSGEDTTFYKWQKKGYHPMFIESRTVVDSDAGTHKTFGFTLDIKNICSYNQ